MRLAVAAAITLWLAPVFAVGVHVFWPSAAGSIAIGLVLGAGVAAMTAGGMTETIGPAFRDRLVVAIVVAAALAAIGQMAWISVYMADPSKGTHSYYPSDPFRVRHSCMTAYVEAIRFCHEPGTNIYRMDLYEPRQIGPLKVDSFHYPPPFLLLPASVDAFARDVFAFRSLWFVMQCLVLAGAIFGIARWIGGEPGALAAAGGVLAFATPQFLFALQQGNVQSTAVSVAAVAFVLLWRGRHAIGAPLLAYVAAAKIFPGILVVHLAAARRWKALAATALAGAAVLALTLVAIGAQPFRDFVGGELPRISSGEAFPHTETFAYGANFSVYGITVRWRKLGLDWLTRPRGLAIASAYGAGVILAAFALGWRRRPDLETAHGRLRLVQCGLALVVLAAMRSPFMPGYGLVGPLWLFTLLAAERTARRGVLVAWVAIAGVAALHAWLPSPALVPQPAEMAAADLLTVILIAACAVTLAREWRTARQVPKAGLMSAVS
ncbi:MAG TPA: glycosyltransferase 87 family protein [Vicinamibacterales bacterium]|nr:glycosyltransferase 87 family protein [Vicinamibacterales bacterium]